MRVLVITASRHGSTNEIGDLVAAELRAAGHQVLCRDAEGHPPLDGIDAAVVGSAVYGARVMSAGKSTAERLCHELDGPVWTFAVGLKNLTKDPLRSATTSPATDGYRSGRYPVFGGVIEPSKLSLAESALIGALGATDRDDRDPEMVQAWATAIAAQLECSPAQAS